MSQEHSFGSGELTPELVRGITFAEVDGRVDAAEVRTFLDRVASSLEVFLSGDAQQALRLEFARNAEIAQQVLDAGQAAAEQLRSQAANEARRLLDETRSTTDRLRAEVEGELAGSREQVIEMRGRLMQDLRDLHDRVGATLYRFERAIEEAPIETAPASSPTSPQVEAPADPVTSSTPTPEPVHVPQPEVPVEEPAVAPIEVAPDVELPDVQLPEGAKAPAWTQLPPDAWPGADATAGDAPHASAVAPGGIEPLVEDATPPLAAFEVIEDEPLAPGEPLVDLRDMATRDADDDARAEALLAGTAGMEDDDAPLLGDEPMMDLGGDWLSAPATDDAPEVPQDAPVAHPSAAGQPAPAAQVDASPDALAVRQLILESITAGQSRDAIENYLREQLGFVEPAGLVDAALASMQNPG